MNHMAALEKLNKGRKMTDQIILQIALCGVMTCIPALVILFFIGVKKAPSDDELRKNEIDY